MTLPRSMLHPLVALIFVLSAAGCDPTSAEWADARVEVDARVVRTIVYPVGRGGTGPIREVTSKRLDEIDCLQSTPRGCSVQETVTATVFNTGTRRLTHGWCDQPLRRFGLGEWHPVTRDPCSAGGSSPVTMEPGDRLVIPVSVERAPAGEYRVSVSLGDGVSDLPAERSSSAAFLLEPLADSPRFACPTESLVELANRVAREALESAAAGRQTPDVTELLLLETRVPGFGGIWLENGSLTAWLTDLSKTDALNAAVGAMFGRPVSIVKKGDYPFSQLVGWKVAVKDVFQILGVHSLDADELNNRVGIGIANELIRADVLCYVRGIGMPDGMALVTVD